MTDPASQSAPLSDAIIVALSRIVDDAQLETREPSHSDLEFEINRAGLAQGDPKTHGQTVGKAKRVRAALSWAVEHDAVAGERLVASLVSHVRACGGFRETSRNYVGSEVIRDARDTFQAEGYELTSDGELRPLVLDSLKGAQLTAALEAYVRRAQRGIADAALVTGTGKDLLEATAAHVLLETYGDYPQTADFPTLLGQAFVAVGLATPQHQKTVGEPAQKRFERALYELGCAVNGLRNKEGTGHGRPWLPSVTDAQAQTAVETMGSIAQRLLDAHKEKK